MIGDRVAGPRGLVVPVFATALLAAACGGGGGGEISEREAREALLRTQIQDTREALEGLE